MENKTTLMSEIVKVLIESLRKQAFSVILLITACGVLWILRTQDKAELVAQITELNRRLDDCSEARYQLSVELATVKASLAVIQSRN